MDYKIHGYVYGKISSIKNIGNEQYEYAIFQENIKRDIIATLYDWNSEIGDEVELIADKDGVCVARHNITKKIKEKLDADIKFPVEIFENQHLNEHDIRKQKLHVLYANAWRLQSLYQKYNYLVEYGGNIWGARDPNCENTFTTPKHYFDNARHICFFYNVVKGRQKIRDTFDEGYLSGSVFNSIVKLYYMEFLSDIKNIPYSYPSMQEFENHFADIKYEVGL